MSCLEHLMIDYSQNMMLLVEPNELRIIIANRVVEKMLGYSKEKLLAMAITDIESSLQDVFYWEDVRSGQYLDIEVESRCGAVALGLACCFRPFRLTVS